MSFSEKIREMQDSVRDSGWRIKHISFLKEGEYQKYPANPFTKFLILLGLLLLGSSVLCMIVPAVFTSLISRFGPVLTREQTIIAGIGGFFCALLIFIVSAAVANYMRCRNWVRIPAECLDTEFRESYHPRTGRPCWGFRALCRFSRQGESYEVTPEISALHNFRYKSELDKFVKKNSDESGRLKLWVNPDNPLETLIGKKPVKGYILGIFLVLIIAAIIISIAWFFMTNPNVYHYDRVNRRPF